MTEKRLKINIKITADILDIFEVFKNNGFKLYIVGGAVFL